MLDRHFSVVWTIENGQSVPYLRVNVRAPNEQVLPYFSQYALDSITPGTIMDYGHPDNRVGHQQRAFIQYWAIRSYVETAAVGIELGSAGVPAPFCLSTDTVGNGEVPEYGGVMSGVQMKVDANNLSLFGMGAFGCVLGNHVLEHMQCDKLYGDETQQKKLAIACGGEELADLFDNHWLRILKPGGYLAQIFPDEAPCRKNGSSSLYHDKTHNHFFYAEQFKVNVLEKIKTPVDIVEFDTLNNNFSVNVVLRKR